MDKQEALLRYKTSMAIFKKWLADGVITADDFSAIDTMLLEKYELSFRSIYRENDLLCREKRANIQ